MLLFRSPDPLFEDGDKRQGNHFNTSWCSVFLARQCLTGGFALSLSSITESAPQIWEATLGHLLLRVTRQNYDSWLRSTAGLRFEGTTLVVVAPNELTCDWLSTRMRSVISQALSAVGGTGLTVRFEPPSNTVGSCFEPVELQPTLLPRLSTPLNPRYTLSSFLP